MKGVVNEPKVFLDLRMAGVVPINDRRTVQFFEQKREITIQRQFLERLAIFDAKLDSARFRLPRNFLEHFLGAFEKRLLFGLVLFVKLSAELFVTRSFLFAAVH